MGVFGENWPIAKLSTEGRAYTTLGLMITALDTGESSAVPTGFLSSASGRTTIRARVVVAELDLTEDAPLGVFGARMV